MAITVIFAVFVYLASGFITYTFGLILGVLGVRKEKTEEYKFSYHVPKSFHLRELSYPLKVLQFVGWPIVLPYLIIFILIRLSELLIDKIQNDIRDRTKTDGINFVSTDKLSGSDFDGDIMLKVSRSVTKTH